MKPPRPPILGTRGQFDTDRRCLANDMVAAGSPLDRTWPETIGAELAKRWFGAVAAASHTAVDRAELEPLRTGSVKTLGSAILAGETGRLGIPLVHVSTDIVFVGDKGHPNAEDAPVAPLNIYGTTSESPEQAARSAGPRSAIIRMAWIDGPHRKNVLKSILAASNRPQLRRRGAASSKTDHGRYSIELAEEGVPA